MLACCRDLSTDRVIALWLLVSVSVVAAGCSEAPTQPLLGEIVGKIIDSEASTPLVRASVTIRGKADTVLTDSFGMFRVADLPTGKYYLLVHMSGYYDKLDSANVTAGSSTSLTIPLCQRREFLLPTTIGTKWQYSFACYFRHAGTGEYIWRAGTHIWQLKSKTQVGDTLILLVESSQTDSIRATYYWHGTQVPPTFDSTYYLSQTVPVTITIDLNSIVFDWSTSLTTGWPVDPYGNSLSIAFSTVAPSLQKVARFSPSDTITATHDVSGSASYISKIGLNSYTRSFSAMAQLTASLQFERFLSH
jgi:hypothetical protein